MSEEKRIIELLGRTEIDGEVRGSHLGKVLTYLKMTKGEVWDVTLSKLALVLGVNPRYIRENYLKGLMYFNVIKLYRNGNTLKWQWIGEKAFHGVNIIPTEPEQTMEGLTDLEKSHSPKQQAEEIAKELEKETKKGYCPNCGKKVKKNQRFCNEECVSEYYIKKKKGKK